MFSRFIVSFSILASCAFGVDCAFVAYVNDPSQGGVFRWISAEKAEMVWYGKQGGRQILARSEGELLEQGTFLHTQEIRSGEEGSVYEFRIGTAKKIYAFKTLPKDLDETRFVIGGDAFAEPQRFQQMNKQVAGFKPDFAVIGGDIAYANTRKFSGSPSKQLQRWKMFFRDWEKQTQTKDGYMLPIVAVLGNHDIQVTGESSVLQDELFYRFFRLEDVGSYLSLDVNNALRIFVLDSGHSAPIPGEQTDWLKDTLADSHKMPYKIAIYHVAAFPSVYPYSSSTSKKIRSLWSPLFEANNVQMAFENHNHAYKRTKPIVNEKVHEAGVIYLGDGCWGTAPRTPIPAKNTWYLENSFPKNSVFLLKMTGSNIQIDAIDKDGNLFDSVTMVPKH